MDNYGLLSLLPPLVAIVLCVTTKQLVLSLFAGSFVGALVLCGGNPVAAFVTAIQHASATVANSSNANILVFTLALGGYIGLMGKSGGMQALVNRTIHLVSTRMRGQLAACILSILLFFDDYTSIILSGVITRPLTDKLHVSREKLSYIVDSCGAGVAATSPVSNWTAYEVGVIGSVLVTIGLTDSAYMTFLQSIPYRFYCLFSVAFVFMIVCQKRDFGKMYEAEKRAITTGQVSRPGSTPMAGLNEEEYHAPEGLAGIMGKADVIGMMTVGIFVSTFVLGIMMVIQKIMNVTDVVDTWTNGMKSVFFTIVFIVLAWMVSSFCKELGTANFVVGALVAANFPAWILPTAVFIIAGIMAFATGSSWGTMALVLPLAMPAAVGLGAPFSAVLGGVLTGATLGDHISPISESVVMSSMSSSCDHLDHVTTQLPYALTVCAISIVCGFIPAGLGVPVSISLLAGLAATFLVVRIVGKPCNEKAFNVEIVKAESK